MRIETINKKSWCEFVNDEYHLPISLSTKGDFFGTLNINNISNDIRFAQARASSQVMKNTIKTESFIFFSMNKTFSWYNGNFSKKNDTGGFAIIDCLKNYELIFPKGNFTKSIVIPYSELNDRQIDMLRQFDGNKFPFQINHINFLINSISNDDYHIKSKFNVIKNLINIDTSSLEYANIDFKLKHLLFNELNQGNTVNIDNMSNKLNVSKRVLQIKLKNLNTSYGTILNEVRNTILSLDNSSNFFYQKTANAGFKSTASFYMSRKQKNDNL